MLIFSEITEIFLSVFVQKIGKLGLLQAIIGKMIFFWAWANWAISELHPIFALSLISYQ
jgi:hypothetical protein